MKKPGTPAWLLEKIFDAYEEDNPLKLIATVRVAIQYAKDHAMYQPKNIAPQQPGPIPVPGPVDDAQPTNTQLAQG